MTRSLRQRLKQPNVLIPGLFVLGFVIMLAANGTMVWVALGSWRGLQTESPWEKGVAYNATLDAEAAEAALGWDLGVSVDPRDDGRHRVAVELADADGEPLYVNRLRVGFVRPTQEGYDTVVELAPQGPGRYAAEVELPLPGLWELRISAERGEDALHTSRRVTLAP